MQSGLIDVNGHIVLEGSLSAHRRRPNTVVAAGDLARLSAPEISTVAAAEGAHCVARVGGTNFRKVSTYQSGGTGVL